ncbi:hypothetical protein [Streptococcus pantholopis]|uniref:hypothetical protein n=1 Tax=Streptococcus pantholopis TaxID=1811193 RepID=UPI003AADA4D1
MSRPPDSQLSISLSGFSFEQFVNIQKMVILARERFCNADADILSCFVLASVMILKSIAMICDIALNTF